MPLTGLTLMAALKMQCDTSGASSAIFWVNINGKLTVAGEYVSEERRARLKSQAMTSSYATESQVDG